MTPSQTHVDVGAYVLGILDEVEHERFEAHLVECHQCQVELQALAGLPDVLDAIREVESAPAPEVGDRVLLGALDEVAAMRRRRRRATWLVGAVAAALIVAAPIVALRVGGTSEVAAPPSSGLTSGQPTPPPNRRVVNGTAGGGAVQASVGMVGKSWGTAIDLELKGVDGPLKCSLIAVSRTGEEQVVGSWLVPENGYSEQNPLKMSGGAGLVPLDISRFEIRTNTGQRLMEIKT